MKELDRIVFRRKQALLKVYVTGVPPVVEWESVTGLANATFLEEFEMVEEEEHLGRRNPRSVAFLSGSGDPDLTASLWVAAKYKGYRSAYLAFIRTVYGVQVGAKDLAGYDVDHLLNRKRAGNDEAFLRIEAIPGAINQLWGSFFESDASTENYDGNKRTRRLMSQAIAAKLAGLLPPAGRRDTAAIRKIADHFAAMGMDRDEVIQHMDTLLMKNEFFSKPRTPA